VDPVELPVLDPAPGPAVLCIGREERESMTLALLRLKPRDGDALRRLLRGETPSEIGAALGISADAARKVVERAMQRARKLARPATGEMTS
jgi:DNA-directed RNA polymerase specialized sigma24 family protein